MILTKDGITVDISHLADIARYKYLGYVEIKDNPNVLEVKETPPVVEVAPEPVQQEKDQTAVEETLQPAKKGKGKS